MRPLRWLLTLVAICLMSLSAAETQVAAGAYHALMLDSDGQVWAWGDNTYGQCGDNTTFVRPTAVKVLRSSGANLDRVIAIAAGSLHSLAVRDDGTVWAWGYNAQGQLGDGSTLNRFKAVQVGKNAGGALDKITAVSAGYYHSMALSGDGQVWTWGSDEYGALGDSFAYSGIVSGAVLAGTDFHSPPFFNHFHIPLSNIIAISAGAWSGYALHANGTVYSWGWGGQGGLGNGGVATMNTATTVQTSAGVNLSGIVSIAGGAYAGYALTSGGLIYSWGANDTGQLAQGSTTDALFATFASNLGIKQISASPFRAVPGGDASYYGTGGHFVALSYTAVPYTCGRDSTLQLGDDAISAQKNALTLISTPGRVKQVAAGGTFTLFLMADGRVLAVGANSNGELGRGTTGANAHPASPANAMWNLVGVQQVSCGGNHTLALRGDGSVWAWGSNTQGQLGTGNQTQAATPVPVLESPGVPMKDIIAVSAGQQHSLALRADGRVFCWGANYSGQSGGADLSNPVLAPVLLFPYAKQISAGGDTSAALTYQGYVQTWGDNQFGTLAAGSSSPTTRFTPDYALVSTSPFVYLNRVRQIELGWVHGIALREDGTTAGWGNNGNGQLGSGASGTTFGADANGTLSNVKQVVAGSYHSAFLLASGTVQGAGYNGYGSLGDGTGSGSPATPVTTLDIPDATGNPARFLSAGTYLGNSTLALMTNGLCRAWGQNGNGQVGNDSTVNALAPDKVYVGASPNQLDQVSSISMGNSHGAAVLSDGTVYCWGLGTSGQLGDGLSSSTDVAVKTDGKWRPQVSITANVSTATEGASTGQFTVTRTGTANGTIVIGAVIAGTAANGTDYTNLAGPFVIPAGSVSKTISVVPIDDAVDEDDETVIVTLTATPTARVGTSGAAQVTIIDNDAAGFLVTGGPLTTTEAPGAGHAATFTIALTSQPLANVTISLISSSPTEATVSPNAVLFTPLNWASAQTITVTGVDDDFADPDAAYTITTNPASSLDPRYNALNPPDVSGNNVNDDVVGFQVSKASITTDESGSTDNFTVRLTSRPTATVTIPVSTSNAGEASVSISALTFTDLNWNNPQTVTVTGINDNPPVVDGPINYAIKLEPATAGSGDYTNQDPPDVTGTNGDDDVAAIAISESAGATAVSEGGATDTYTVVLATKPSGSVTISVAGDAQVSASPASLVFTSGNWNTPQTVTVTAIDDQVAEGAHSGTVSHSASSSDSNYQGLSIAQVMAQVSDNDTAGFVYGAISSDTTEAGGTADFTVRLATKPTSDVSIDFTSSDSSEGIIATTLVFTPLTWNLPQTVTATGVDDSIDDGDQTWSADVAAVTSLDPLYQALPVGPAVSITNRDDDVAGLVVGISGGSTDLTEGGATDSITIALSSQPLSDVTVNLNGGGQVNCSPSALTFTTMNWNVAQPVTLSAVNDNVAEGTHAGTVSFSQLSVDALYAGLSAPSVTVAITDNDTADFVISSISGHTSESGTTATFTVHLASQPPVGFTVSIPLSSSNPSEGTVLTSSPLVFDHTNYNTDQTVTVQGVNDNPPVVDGSIGYSIVLGAVTSSDPFYSGLNPPDVAVTNDDDDTAGITISETGGSTSVSESGTTDTITVVLSTQPVGTVLVTLSGGAQASVSPSVLSFTVSNWNTAQAVTIGAVDDHQIEGNHLGSVTLSAADGGYDAVLAGPVAVSITDNDSAGFSITPTSGLVTSEAGATAQFSVVLTAQPTADVVLPLSTSDAAQGSPNVASLTFTTADWDVPQFVTINGLDDLVADALVSTPYTIITGDPTSADTHFGNLTATDVDDVSVSNLDDDIPGVTVTPLAGLTTSEAGAVAIFTVRLNTTPGANVTIAVTSSNTNEATVSPNSLSFTSTTPQLVTVTGVDDDVDDGNQTVTIQLGSCVSADSSYSGINPPDVAITNLDDDTAGGIVDTGGSLLVVEGSTTDTYTIRLSTRPTGTVTVQLTPSNQLTVDTDGGTAGDQTSLVFSTTDFSTPKTVTVRAVDDSIAEGFHTGTIAHSTTGGGFDGVSLPTVTATIADNDNPGFVISAVAGTITESGGTATFSVRLANQPGAAVSVAVSSSDLTEGTVSPSSLSFTPANWNTAQTVTVTGQDDAVADGNVAWTVVLAAATSTDPLYNGIDPADVDVVTNDNDVAGVTIAQTGGGTAVAEGGFNDTWTIVLNSKPTASVTVTVSSTSSQVIVDADSSSVGDQSTVSFTPVTWNVPRTIAVRAVDDAIVEGPHNASITMTVSGGGYGAVTIPSVAVDVTDNDSPSVVVTQTSGTTAVGEGGLTDTYSIVLAAAPSGPVTISLAPPARVTVSPAAVTFQPTAGLPNGWDIAQTITVGAVENQIAEGSTNAIITHTATGGGFAGVSIAGVSVSISDNDLPGITVSPTSGLTTTESGGSAAFTVVLTSQPTADVTVPLSSGDSTEGAVSPASLIFTAVNWSIPQQVTVTGVNDNLDDGDIAYAVLVQPATGADTAYQGIDAPDVALVNIDNDAAGVVLSTTAVSVTEGGAGSTYTVRLASQPTGTVTVLATSDGQLNSTPGFLTFTTATGVAGGWDSPQTITVNAVDDAVAEGTHAGSVGHAASGGGYDGVIAASVSATITDNDSAGYNVSASNVVCHESFKGVRQLATTGITSGNVVAFPVGTDLSTIFVGQQVQFDGGGPNSGSSSVVSAIDDANDTITMSGTLTLTGSSENVVFFAGFTLSLTSQPTSVVLLAVSTDDASEAFASPGSLTFSPANWSVPQVVTIRGVDDQVDDGDVAFTVVLAAAVSSDGFYSGLNPSDVAGVCIDDDTAGISTALTAGVLQTTEAGGTSSFTVKLDSRPTATVTIGLSVSDPNQATLSLASVPFDAGDWNTAKTVVVTGADVDGVDNGAGTPFTVIFAPVVITGGSDANYDGKVATPLSGTNLAVNAAPQIDSVANQSANEDAAPFTVTMTGIGTGQIGENQTLTITSTSDNPALIPNPAVGAQVGTTPEISCDLTISPIAGASGQATISVRVQDDGGTALGGSDVTTISFTVTVVAVNDPPVVDLNGPAAGGGATAAFTEGGGPVLVVDPGLTIADQDSPTLSEVNATLVNLLDSGEQLTVNTAGTALTATWSVVGSSGLLTIAGPSDQPLADFQLVLRSLRYTNPSSAPTTTDRTVQVVADDGGSVNATSAMVSSTITVVPVNNPPSLDLNGPGAGAGYAGTFSEGDAPSPLVAANALVVDDADNAQLAGATATIINGGVDSGAFEILSAATTGTLITANWTAATMSLSLTGGDTIANYQQVLRSLTYRNESEAPAIGLRQIEVLVNDGIAPSPAGIISLMTVTAVDDAPVVDLNGPSAGIDQISGSFTEGGAGVILAGAAASISDVDDAQISQLRVTILDQVQSGEEQIVVATGSLAAGMSQSFNATIGELTISGSASAAAYTTALRGLTYVHSGEAPTGSTRSIRFIVDAGGQSSAPALATVTLSAVNDPPRVDLNGAAAGSNATASAAEDQAPVPLCPTATLSDPDHSQLARITVTPVTRPDGSAEVIAVTVGSSGLSATFDVNGVLNLAPSSGPSAARTAFEQVLRTLTYQNTLQDPTIGGRTCAVQVEDPQGSTGTAQCVITVTKFNDPAVVDLNPITTGSGSVAGFTENDPPVPLAPTATIVDVDNAQLSAAQVTIATGPEDGSNTALLAVNTAGTAITAVWTQATLSLALSGADTVANYQAVLRTLTYANTSENPPGGVRSIQVQVDDGQSPSNVAVCSLTVTAVPDLPVVDLNAGASGIDIASGTFTENGASLLLADPAATIVDLDHPSITELRATITNLAQPNQEFIEADHSTIVGAMLVNFNPIIGELTVTGTATVAEYQAVLRGLRYRHSGEAPSAVGRKIRIIVLSGGQSSGPATATVDMAPINDPPTVDLNGAGAGTGTSATYAEGQAPVALANLAVLGDLDNTDLSRVEVTPASRPDGSFEQLAVSLGTSGLDATVDAVSGKLTLSPTSGTLPIAAFQDVLRTLTWIDTSDAPTTGNRTLTVSIQDPQGAVATAAISIDVSAVNDPPVVDLDSLAAGTGSVAGFTENDLPVPLAPTATLIDADTTQAAAATISIASGPDNGSTTAVLAVDTTGTSITATWTQASLVLALSGTDTTANYQAVLRTLTYANSSENPPEGLRSIQVRVNDGLNLSAAATCSLTVTAVPDAPLVDLDSSSAGSGFAAGDFTEGSGPLAIAAGTALISDPDSVLIVRLRAAILAGQIGSEILAIDPATLPSGVTASFNQANGELTIDGSATALEYSVILRSLTYRYTGEAPSSGTRSIQVVAEAAGQASSPAVATVTLIPVNDPPTVNLQVATATYVEGSSAIAPLVGAVVGDPDHLELSSMTITPLSRPDGDLEVVAVSITGTSLSMTTALDGTITLTGGPSPVADFQQVLRSLTWLHSGRNPTEGSRTLQIRISDGSLAATADLAISVVAVNDLPTISLLAADVEVNRGARQVITSRLPAPDGDPVNGFLAATDVETPPMALIFTVILLPSQGKLLLLPSAGAATGTQIAKGDTFTQAQLVAGLVLYEHDNNLGSSDGFAITVKDGAGGESPPAVLGIHINLGQQPPVVTLGGEVQTFIENSQPVLVDAGAQVTDSDSTDFSGGLLTVRRSGGGAGDAAGDILDIRNQGTDFGQISVQSLTINFGQGAGIDPLPIGTIASDGIGKDLVVQLNENATPVRTQALLGNLQFSHAGDNPTAGDRQITVTLSDGDNGTSSPATKAVTVVPVNDAPAALPRGALLVVPLLSVSGQVIVTDPEGSLASAPFSIAQPTTDLPTQGLVTLDPTTGQFTYSAFAAAAGNDSFTVTATDAGGLTVRVPVPVHITPPGEPPPGEANLVFTSLPPLRVDSGAPLVYVPVVTGAPATELTFTLVGLEGVVEPPVFNPATGAVNWQAVPMPVGGYHVFSILVAHPKSGAAAVQPVLLLVNAAASGKG
ncbi:hypothetical protein LBMAG53_05860 [Planctomycetota bacterium]|nr:hypothetical protein LBMAG53_05860 [Planctomycetota bacterium]